MNTDFKPIKADAISWPLPQRVSEIREDDEDAIRSLLVGHRIEKVAEDHIRLDDGTLVKLVGHDGGCVCSAGCYDLTELSGVDNVITDVKIEREDETDDDETDSTYRIFVFTGAEKINLATFEGTDGNGYYGTGFHLFVRAPEATR